MPATEVAAPRRTAARQTSEVSSDLGELDGRNQYVKFVDVAGGDYHSLALKSDGTVYAWGDNAHGQLGVHSDNSHNIAVQVHGPGNVGYLTGIIQVAAGKNFSLALRNDGTVWAWGENSHGQLGVNSNNDHSYPVQVHGPANVGYLTGIGPTCDAPPPGGAEPAICHRPGTPQERTIHVPERAFKGHLLHGDTLGACPPARTETHGAGSTVEQSRPVTLRTFEQWVPDPNGTESQSWSHLQPRSKRAPFDGTGVDPPSDCRS